MPESADIFKKFHDAKDPAGDEAFAVKVRDRAVGLRKPDALDAGLPWDELTDEVRAFVTLLRIPRRFKDLENGGGLAKDRALAVLRGLLSAELVDVSDPNQARALIPVEVRKALAEVKGQQLVRKKLVANVYRPTLEGDAAIPPPPEHNVEYVAARKPAPEPPPPDPVALAKAAAAAKLETEFQALRAELEEAHKKLASQNHFEVLGLQRTDGDDKIKACYLNLVKKWHPDRLSGITHADVEVVRKKAQELFSAVGEAYRVLLEKSSRQAYLNDLTKREQSGGGAAPRRPPVRAEEAKLHGQKGKVYIQKKEYAQAEAEYKRAMECDPALAEYKVEHAWAHALNPTLPEKDRRTEALELLRDVVKGSPRFADVYYKLGMVLRIINEPEKAEAHFRKALDLDKKHEDAAKEVRVMELRAERKRAADEAAAQAQSKSGSVMDMFKKKPKSE